ncbi:MAG: hypothetical protein OXC46_03205, partial [Thaumarchaeota archaeon]|nr:hypothetical protein [Nitrososphaerota archaeon]
ANKSGINGITDWNIIKPDAYNDWLNKRGEVSKDWENHIPLGDKNNKNVEKNTIFQMFSLGIATHRDAWVYNKSKKILTENIKRHIDFCNSQNLDHVSYNSKLGAWNNELTDDLKKLKQTGKILKFDKKKIRMSLYRPFFKQFLYFEPILITAKYRIPSFFPNNDKNPTIIVPDKTKDNFSTMVVEQTPDLEAVHHGQTFPLKTKNTDLRVGGGGRNIQQSVHSDSRQDQRGVFSVHNGHDTRPTHTRSKSNISVQSDDMMQDNITDWALERYQTIYKDKSITKEDIFYYTYGILHSSGFREKYKAFLVRGIPNIPFAPDFRAFEKAGRELADLHLNFETCRRFDLGEPLEPIPKSPKKITFGRKPRDRLGPKEEDDYTKIKIDDVLVYSNLPIIHYKVNGNTPVGWFVDRYSFRIDQKGKSGNTNWPLEGKTGTDVRAILERLVYVGIESDNIINELPDEFEMNVEKIKLPNKQKTRQERLSF